MIHVVGLLARAGHGKTTVATHLRTNYGATPISLAGPLKEIAKTVMGFTHSQLWGTQEQKEEIDPRYGISPRIFLQRLGTEGIRTHLGPDTWLNALVHRMIEAQRGDPSISVFVVDDMRFLNEASFLQGLANRNGSPKFFASVIKIVCTDAPPSGNDNHPSEAEIDQVPANLIDATVVSSRAQGVDHLILETERAIDLPHLRNLRVGLLERARAVAATARSERLRNL